MAHQACLNIALGKILSSREIRQKLFLQGWKDQDTSSAVLVQRIRSDTAVYSKLISSRGIRIEGLKIRNLGDLPFHCPRRQPGDDLPCCNKGEDQRGYRDE
ncbi:MAG: hypothetical protein RLZZ401_2197 [Pseudomonadota bacterium]